MQEMQRFQKKCKDFKRNAKISKEMHEMQRFHKYLQEQKIFNFRSKTSFGGTRGEVSSRI